MKTEALAEERFERWLERKIQDGAAPDPRSLCEDCPQALPALRSLIARFEGIDDLLPSPTSTSDPALASAGRAPAEPPVVEAFEVLSLLGAGGMGEVWEAEQLEPVRRRVALKVIRRGTGTGHVVNRFAAEQQALAALEHPAIAKVFDAGATADGRPYFAMELVRGEPIDRFADQHRLSVEQRLELFVQVCDGVQHAHQRGLIHRDLKPSNILVSLREEGELESAERRFEPKLIDFGIAKATTPEILEQDTLTQFGQVVGTPAFMSPEQADLSRQDIDTRSDVYSLGVVLYQLMVGVLPLASGAFFRADSRTDFAAPSARARSLRERSAEIAKARSTDSTSLAGQLRGEIDWIVMKALAHDREARYDSVASLAEDLRRRFRDEPVEAGPPSRLYRLRKLASRHRAAVAAALLVLVAVIAALAGLSLGLQRALRAEARATAEAEVARRVSDFLVEAFEAGDPGLSGAPVTAREVVDRAASRIGDRLSEELPIRARLTEVLAQASLNLGELGRARALAGEAIEMLAELH
ncbi:MAG: serine/threonine-protein kinase, partial [Acidobacteriota bacterium]